MDVSVGVTRKYRYHIAIEVVALLRRLRLLQRLAPTEMLHRALFASLRFGCADTG